MNNTQQVDLHRIAMRGPGDMSGLQKLLDDGAVAAQDIVAILGKSGAGKSPKATETVKVHYHGTLTDGTVFDSSVERGEPATFPVNGVIPGWIEALQLMKEGDKWQLVIPPKLAYGERGAGGHRGSSIVDRHHEAELGTGVCHRLFLSVTVCEQAGSLAVDE